MAYACRDREVGMLVSLGLSDEVVEDICKTQREKGKEVWAVNYNTDGQIVIAGAKKDLEELVPVLKGARQKGYAFKYVGSLPLSTFRELLVEPLKGLIWEGYHYQD